MAYNSLEKGFLRIAILLSFLTITALDATSNAYASTPRITRVELGSAVAAQRFIMVPHQRWGQQENATIWINATKTWGNATSGVPANVAAANNGVLAGNPLFLNGTANMSGTVGGFGALLAQFRGDTVGQFVSGAIGVRNITNSRPRNNNTEAFGGVYGPINLHNLCLYDAGIDANTKVQFTLDMNGTIPHLVAVMGGSEPVVTYDSSGSGTMVINSTTTNTTTAAGIEINSTIGFVIFANTALDSTPFKIISQTDTWAGDIFPVLPGYTTNASNASIGGTKGTFTARCGTTFAGITGESRTASHFVPLTTVPLLFGSQYADIDNGLIGFDSDGVRDTQMGNATVRMETNWGGVPGIKIRFPIVFSSKRDTTVGVADTVPEEEIGGESVPVKSPTNVVKTSDTGTAVAGAGYQTPTASKISSDIGSSVNGQAAVLNIAKIANQLNSRNNTYIRSDATYNASVPGFTVKYSPPAATFNVTTAGDTALIGWEFNGTKINATIGSLSVYKFIPSGLSGLTKGVKKYKLRADAASINQEDGEIWFTAESDNATVLPNSKELDQTGIYIMWALITDNGEYDLDRTGKLIVDPPTVSPGGGGSSSSTGCMVNPAASFGLEWLMVLAAPLLLLIRSRGRRD